MKGNKGITLIALVITIIVLLILAGVSIAMLTGENSILKRGSQASAENELGAANDAVSLFVTEKIAEFYEKSYVEMNNTTLTTGLNGYLNKTVTKNTLQVADVVDPAGRVTVKEVNIPEGKDSNDGTITMTAEDNAYKYTSTGTVRNGKITWKITKTPTKK